MDSIYLCTNSKSKLNQWKSSLQNNCDCLHVRDKIELEKYLSQDDKIVVLFDCKFVENPFEDIDFYVKEYLHVKIFYLQDLPSYKDGKSLLALGVKGYGNSRMSTIPLIQAVQSITNGNVWLYPDFLQELIKDVTPSFKIEEKDVLENLTNKEKDLSLFVAQGLSNKKIAEKLNISESTVKVHIRSIFSKLNVKDRLSLALLVKKL